MGLNVRVYRDLEQLDESAVTFWQQHQWHPYGDIDLVAQEYQDNKGSWQPYLIAIRDQQEIIAWVIGKILKVPLKLQFGYKVVAGPALTTLVVHRSGFIGKWRQPLYALLQKHWREMLAAGLVDAVQVRVIPLASPLHEIAAAGLPFHCYGHFEVVQEYWQLNKVECFEAFLKTHTHLKNTFRKHSRRLKSFFGDGAEIKCFQHSHELKSMLIDSEAIARTTWQRKLGDPSFAEDGVRSRYHCYFEKGWARAYFLYLDRRPVAFLRGIIYRGVFHALEKGYDPDYQDFGVGTYLLLEVIRRMCEEPSIHAVDFNVGNAEDKRRYCDSVFKVSDIHLFRPGSRLWILVMLRLAAQGTHELAKSISHRWGFYQSVRKRWRHG